MSGDGVVRRADVGLGLAERIVAGVREEAASRGKPMGIVVVDSSARLVLAARMDGAQVPAVELAQDKAYTAAAFGRPTEAWAESTVPGGEDWGLSTVLGGRFVPFAGGLPIVVDGEVVGGIGVSGAAADVDRACAAAGLRAAGLSAS